MGVIRSNYIPTLNPATQRAVVHQTSDGETVVHQRNDVSGILKANQFEQGTQTMHHGSQVLNHVARIDTLALQNWCRRRGITKRWWYHLFADDGKLFREFVNDPENKCWRTRLGKI